MTAGQLIVRKYILRVFHPSRHHTWVNFMLIKHRMNFFWLTLNHFYSDLQKAKSIFMDEENWLSISILWRPELGSSSYRALYISYKSNAYETSNLASNFIYLSIYNQNKII